MEQSNFNKLIQARDELNVAIAILRPYAEDQR